MVDDEARLIQRAKEGDPTAFAQIYDRCQPPVYRYIFYRVSGEATAEDLCGEVFARLVEHIDGFSYDGRPLLAWLYTVARNVVNDHHRRRGRGERVPLDDSLEGKAPDPEGMAELALNQARLSAALEQLTDGQRQVIMLRFLEGLDNATVAQILNKSYGAVKALQHRGLASLRRVLESGEV